MTPREWEQAVERACRITRDHHAGIGDWDRMVAMPSLSDTVAQYRAQVDEMLRAAFPQSAP